MIRTETISMIDVIDKIDQYIKRYKWPYSEWCIGVAEDPREILCSPDQGEETGPWIYTSAGNREFAKAIQQHFTEVLGAEPERRYANTSASVVYAYRRAGGLS